MKKKKTKVILISLIVVVLIIIGSFSIYINDYYHSDETAVQCLASAQTVEKNYYTFGDSNSEKGFIFYPGGKVEYTSYAPLMKQLSENGYFCIVAKMPCNLAVFDKNAAKGLTSLYPQIKEWYIGGHSLGGVMATAYANEHSNEFKGIILLASYSTTDLTNCGLDVLSIYGTQDRVLNMEKYNENKDKLPQNTTTVIIDGGCHSYFGDYGNQSGDGTPSISRQEQLKQTVEAINNFTNNK